jgi:hypothetical protein
MIFGDESTETAKQMNAVTSHAVTVYHGGKNENCKLKKPFYSKPLASEI